MRSSRIHLLGSKETLVWRPQREDGVRLPKGGETEAERQVTQASYARPQRESQTCDQPTSAKLPGGKGPEPGRRDGKGSSAVTNKWPVSRPDHTTQTGHTGPCPGETSALPREEPPRAHAPSQTTGQHRCKGREGPLGVRGRPLSSSEDRDTPT